MISINESETEKSQFWCSGVKSRLGYMQPDSNDTVPISVWYGDTLRSAVAVAVVLVAFIIEM